MIVRGRVQGVGYRAFVHHQAELHGLSGSVRNRRDGSVEAVLAGPASAIDAVVRACREGPRTAKVDEVTIEEADAAAVAAVRPGVFEVLATV
jgi:acylphosphatase